MSMTWPAFSAVWRVATATSDVPVNEAVKATRNLAEGIEGIVPLSKSKGIEAAKTVTPASDACDSSLGDDQQWRDARHSTSVPLEFSICSLHDDGAHATVEGTSCLFFPFWDRIPNAGIDNEVWMNGTRTWWEREIVRYSGIGWTKRRER